MLHRQQQVKADIPGVKKSEIHVHGGWMGGVAAAHCGAHTLVAKCSLGWFLLPHVISRHATGSFWPQQLCNLTPVMPAPLLRLQSTATCCASLSSATRRSTSVLPFIPYSLLLQTLLPLRAVDGDMLRIAVERKTEKHEEFEAQKEQRKGHAARIHQ